MCNLSEGIWEDGIELGVKQGRTEATEEIAVKMLRKRTPMETVAEFTALSLVQVQALVKTNNIFL